MDTWMFIFAFFIGACIGCLFVSLTKRQLIKDYKNEISSLRSQLLRKRK